MDTDMETATAEEEVLPPIGESWINGTTVSQHSVKKCLFGAAK